MNTANYFKVMLQMLQKIPQGEELLLHACCAPCATSVLEVLAAHFRVTLLCYNPNTWPREEYALRRSEMVRLPALTKSRYPVRFAELPYDEQEFLVPVRGLECEPEGGVRCAVCFAVRLRCAAAYADAQGIPWFTTTLTVSPHKDATLINQLGQEIAQKSRAHFLPSDFKKADGYRRSIELSAVYGIYRQDYCGCRFSVRDASPKPQGARDPG